MITKGLLVQNGQGLEYLVEVSRSGAGQIDASSVSLKVGREWVPIRQNSEELGSWPRAVRAAFDYLQRLFPKR